MRPWFVVLGTGAVLLSGALQLQRGHALFALAMLLLATAMVLPLFEPQARTHVAGQRVTLRGWRVVAYWALLAGGAALLFGHVALQG